MSRKIDLHVHSTFSDGIHTPTELIHLAVTYGVSVLALADHDSMDGIDEARSAAANTGIEIVPAVELSVEFSEYNDVHLLGYLIEHHDETFRDALKQFRLRRDERGKRIIDRINEHLAAEKKDSLRYEDLTHSSEGALGRPHIARRLIAIGAVRTMQEAFDKYLEPCNVPKQYFPMEDALAEIRRVGGVAVLAHPTSISNDRSILFSVIKELAEMGLDGIEAFSNMSTFDDSRFLKEVADGLGLLVTGGSDFHGGDVSREIGTLHNGIKVTDELMISLRRRHEEIYRGRRSE